MTSRSLLNIAFAYQKRVDLVRQSAKGRGMIALQKREQEPATTLNGGELIAREGTI
jgi:hypothetical protein